MNGKTKTIGMLVRLGACALATIFATGIAYGKSFSLDLRRREDNTPKKRLLAAANSENDGTLRSFNLDAGAADVGEIAVEDILTFTLFDDVTLELELKEQMQSPIGGDVFLAEVAGYEGIKTAVVLRTADGLTIDVQDFLNDKVYKVISSQTGVKVLEIQPSNECKCGCDTLEASVLSYTPAQYNNDGNPIFGQYAYREANAASRFLGAASQQSDTCVDILVAYDRNAASYANAQGGGTTNFANVAVQKMNTALSNTGLDASFRFRLVGVVVNESVAESTLSDTLNGVSSAANTYWEIVRNKRDELGADIVCVLIDPGSEGDMNNQSGLSWGLWTTAVASFSGSAYNVCTIMSVANGHTMTHEVGHNMGCGHSTEQETQPGPQLYDYSAGYYFKTEFGSYCTIMAYGHEGPKGTRIPYFSSPIHYYEGVAVGDDSHDNTRTLANTFSAAAQWREQILPTTYDIGFEPASGTTFDGTLEVSIIPGKRGIEIHYTLDGSDPTIDSPLYEGPITISRQTTIKAAMCANGVCFSPYTATYHSKSDFGAALGLPELDWEIDASRTAEWSVQTTNTWDGSALGAIIPENGRFNLCAVINGPAILEYRASTPGWNNVNVEITCDDTLVSSYLKYSSEWEKFEFTIPPGEHQVVMHFSPLSARASLSLDDMVLRYVSPPVIEPKASSDSTLATPFVSELCISIDCPDEGAYIYYTLDGSEPNEKSLLYEGPFFINESTRVKAVAVKADRGRSKIVEGCYAEHSLPKPGEWTQYGDGAVEAARNDGGRMIVFLACTEWCGFCKLHYKSSRTELFKDWAAANGIYLVDVLCDNSSPASESISRHFWPLHQQTAFASRDFGYPSYVFADAADATRALGAMQGIANTTGKTFSYTPESLMECFASHLGADAPLGAPVASVSDAYARSFPFDVTLSNTNATGTIYYTVDGSSPTRNNGIEYANAITIEEPGTILKAVVWPDDENGVSSVPLMIKYESLTDAIGMRNVSWSIVGNGPTWSIVASDPVSLRGGKNPALTSGTSISILKAAVAEPGIIRFDPKVVRKTQASQLEFRVNGNTVATYSSSSNARVEYIVEEGGETTFEWVYTCSYLDNSSENYGAWINNIVWESHDAPGSPVNLIASQGTEAIGTLLQWQSEPNAKRYVIRRSESDILSLTETIGTTQKTFYWDMGAEPGKIYNYWVFAENEYGIGDPTGPKQGWIPAVCRVTFDANGGWGGMRQQVFKSGTPQNLSKNTFSNSGMRFVGWALSPDGDVCYQDESEVMISEDVTLFAKWAKDMIWTIDNGTLSAVDMNGETEAFVPAGVKAIAASLFAGKSTLTRVVLPNGVTSIGREAFKGCANLVSINIPDSVTSIGSGAFDGCSSSLYENQNGIRLIDGWICGFSQSLYGDIALNGVRGVVPGCLSDAKGLFDLFIEVGFNELPDYAFSGCTALRSVFLSEGLVSIGTTWGHCFYNCTSLEQVHLPSTLKTIYGSTFSYCPITELEIPEGVEAIPQNMCWECGELERVSLPESVKSIGICAFDDCVKLADVVLPDNLTELAEDAFSGCKSLEYINIPDSVTIIESAFRGCEKLNNIVLPNGLKTLAGGAFSECRSLAEIVIPEGITSIGGVTFSDCFSLERVEMRGCVTSIGWGAFQNCKKLRSIVLPESLESVGGAAFADCAKLRFLFAPSGLVFPSDAFDGCPDDLKIFYYDCNKEDIDWAILKYDGNGGEGDMMDDIVISGETFNLSRNRFSNAGLCFMGWSFVRDGEVEYRDGDEICLTSNTILYAVWSEEVHSIDTELLPAATEMQPYEFQLEASGGVPPYAWVPLVDSYEVSNVDGAFNEDGQSQGWSDYSYKTWELPLPFVFKFYGKPYTKVYVNANGTLSFGGANPNGGSYNENSFSNAVVIAALQASYARSDINDIFITETDSYVTVRWTRLAKGQYSTVLRDYIYTRCDFSATLGSDGTIRFSYGTQFEANGERYCDYFIGLSAGDGIRQIKITRTTDNVNDILVTPCLISSAYDLPEGLSLSVDGVLSGTPTEAGEYEIKVGVSDATRNRVDKAFSFTVADNQNERPVINSFTPVASVSLPTGTSKTFKVVASDPEGGTLTYHWELDGVTVQGAIDNSYVYMPSAGDEGTHTLTCYISDDLWKDVISQSWRVSVSQTVRVTPLTTSDEWEKLLMFNSPGRIVFAPGEYDLSSVRFYLMYGSVVLEGEDGAANTIINGGFDFYDGSVVIKGLTVDGGLSLDSIMASSDELNIVEECIIRNGQVSVSGSRLINCVITDCSCRLSGTQVEFCTIIRNENVRLSGYQGYSYDELSCSLVNSIIWDNVALDVSDGTVINCCCIDEAHSGLGEGNITDDPGFADAEGGDFRLRSNSPCIDAAMIYDDMPAVDINGGERVQGAAPNMGSCEDLIAGCFVAKRVFGHGNVTADRSSVEEGSSITFTASGLRPFIQYETNGVFATSENVFTWSDIRDDGVLTAIFAEYTWHVDAKYGMDSNDGLSSDTPKRTIQNAVDNSLPGENILVASGTYESVITSNKAVRIMATGEIGSVVIDGDFVERCATVATSPSSSNMETNTVFYGFVLRNGYASQRYGGGALGGTFQNCIISNCVANTSGGGAAYAALENCLVVGNRTAGDSYGRGGGAYESFLFGCTVVGNNAGSTQGSGGGVYGGRIYNSIIWGNTVNIANPSVSNVSSIYDSENMANCWTSDPVFRDLESGDYALADDSPCIDAGNSSYAVVGVDLNGAPRIAGSSVDIGAYEWHRDVRIFTVAFNLDGKGRRIGGGELTQNVEIGTAAVAPDVQANEGWEFLGWDADFSCVESNLTVNAIWRQSRLNAPVINAPSTFEGDSCTVTITAEDGASIHYALDGSEPTVASAIYTGPITITDTATISAIAMKSGFVSAVSSVTVTHLSPPQQLEVTDDMWYDWSTLRVAPGTSIRFYYDLGEIDDNFYCYGDGVPMFAVVADNDEWRILEDILEDNIPNSGYFDWTAPLDAGTYCIGFTYEDLIGQDGEDCYLDDIIGFEVQVGVFHSVVFNIGEHGVRNGGGALSQEVLDGGHASAPRVHANEGWTFLGWDVDFSRVESDITVNAIWRQSRLNTPVINAPSTFEGDSCSVNFSVDDGASIHYTLDGSVPTAASALYTGPITITDTTTIRAIAMKSGFDNSEVSSVTVTRLPWTFGEYLNWPEQIFTTGGDAEWTREKGVSEDGYALKSGAIGNRQTSDLTCVVQGPGTISFWCKVSSEAEDEDVYDGLVFSVDGVDLTSLIGGEVDWTNLAFAVDGSGEHTLEWRYEKDKRDYGGEDCAWLDEVTWTPVSLPDPIPPVESDDDVATALAGTTDENLTANVTNATQYADYRTWALSVTNATTTAQVIKESDKAWLSFALGADKLIEEAITKEDVSIDSFEPSTEEPGEFSFEVTIKDVNISSDADKARLATVLGVEGAASLEDSAFSPGNVDFELGTPKGGKATITAKPKDSAKGDGGVFFMRVRVNQ